ncbi:ABC transporter substrate-binding protein [Cohnella rhizoplanae]|uniref:ABC transporter substrate-binding protein n=1 Tax=Cohnella rhizoplanae TaxID=2974897 RepID=UPI0022FF7F3F|nr:ABC transporter substrate-binding protein [Cohnella sp. JJ-181]CAI6083114.1 hypothetical protein COHCIP112018_03872 [Cohnella sp. JJ-181]
MLRKRNGLKLTAAAAGIAVLLSACGGNNGNNNASPSAASSAPSSGSAGATASSPASGSASASADLKPVELVWYLSESSVPADLPAVQDAVNKIAKEKINATVKLMVVGSGDYNQKMNTVIASGEKLDLMWTANWNFDYVQNQSKGAFLPLDDLLNQYAPDVVKSMPDYVWDATKIDGKIYAVPNYQTVINKEGFVIQKEYIDKYKLDTSTLKKFSDLGKLMETVKKGENAEYVYAMNRDGNFGNLARTYNLEVISGIAYINLNDPAKVVNIYETPELRDYYDTVRDWYQKGYINQDAATLKSKTDMQKAGKAIFGYDNVLKPGGEIEAKVKNGGKDMVYVPLTDAYTGTNTIITTMQAISANSENPERAMMFLNLVNTDKDLFNLLAFGIEGKHYTKNADGSIKLIPDSGYAMADWSLGNVFNGYTIEGKDPNVAELTKKSNEEAKPSPIMGFKFKTDPVSAEIANVNAVSSEYAPGLNTGTIAPDDNLAEFQAKLKEAGADKIIAEVQKQLDEWRAAQGK